MFFISLLTKLEFMLKYDSKRKVMRLFEIIKKKLEKKRLEAEQARQAEKDYVKNLLKSPIPCTECIIELSRLVREDDHSYIETAYFMCDTPRGNMYYGEQYDVTKITGDDIGAKETLLVHSSIKEWGETAVILIDSNDKTWSGRTDNLVYVPSRCKTIGDLNVYNAKHNKELKTDSRIRHERKQQEKTLNQ